MAGNPDMVRAYLESIIERLTGSEKAVPDHEGDYAIEWAGARFWARVDGREVPIVRLYSTVLTQLEATPTLFERLNDINSRMAFLRAFWVNGQVIFEHEHLGLSMEPEEFQNSFRTIAQASDFFGPQLHEEFGGQQGFHESKSEDYEPPTPDAGSHPGYL